MLGPPNAVRLVFKFKNKTSLNDVHGNLQI